MMKKLYNKSPGKINVKRNFLIAQMGQETFKSMIGYLQKCEDPLEAIQKRDKNLFTTDELYNQATFLQN